MSNSSSSAETGVTVSHSPVRSSRFRIQDNAAALWTMTGASALCGYLALQMLTGTDPPPRIEEIIEPPTVIANQSSPSETAMQVHTLRPMTHDPLSPFSTAPPISSEKRKLEQHTASEWPPTPF